MLPQSLYFLCAFQQGFDVIAFTFSVFMLMRRAQGARSGVVGRTTLPDVEESTTNVAALLYKLGQMSIAAVVSEMILV